METYHGNVKSPADAIILFEACRLGLLPRVQRRLSEKERQQIKSGSVFVWDEREAGMRRWTDGKSWSASRVSGSFLTYREMEGKRGGSSFANSGSSNGGSHDGRGSDGGSDIPIAGEPDGYRYKPDGLMKQSFSITTSQGQHLHLISYCARSHPSTSALPQPTTDPALRHIRPQKGMYPESTIHDAQNMPAVTRSPMISSPYNSSPYTTSPHSVHSQNYLRHSPHVPSPGYGWPPSPMSTPPTYAASYPQNYHAQQPPSGTPGQAPTYYNHPQRPPGPTAFDRAPPPMRNGGVPPPPPPPHTYPVPQHHSPIAQQYQPPPPNSMPHQVAPAPQESAGYPRPPYNQQGGHYRNTSDPQYNIDPRLNAKLAQERHQGQPYPAGPDRLTPPSQYQSRDAPSQPTADANGSGAGKIPSINHIINRSPSPRQGHTPPERRAEVGPRPYEGSPSASGKTTNGHSSNRSGDIGSSNYSEDQKALKQLDRAFAA